MDASLWISRGWSVFPVVAGGKQPLVRWKQASTKEPAQIAAWLEQFPGCNWAVDCDKSNLAVVDVDGQEGMDGLAQLELLYDVPATLTHRTPRGGLHLIYRGACKTTVGVLRPHIDTRSSGNGYILLPGSVVNGEGYTVETDVPVADVPAWVVELAGERSEKAEHAAPVVELDLPESIAEACRVLRTSPPAVEGEGGNNRTYQVACRMRDCGLSEPVALQLMLDLWNPRCLPPWDPDDLARTTTNAYTYAANPSAGTDSPQARLEQAQKVFTELAIEEDPDKGLEYDTVGWMMAHEPPPRRWLVQGWIPQGTVTLLTGDPGCGKSALAIQLALGCRIGKWLEWDVEKCNAMYLGCEDSRDELWRRVWDLKADDQFKDHVPAETDQTCLISSRLGRINGMGIFHPSRGLITGKLYDDIVKHYRKQPKGGFLAIDTVSDVLLADSNVKELVNAFIKTILGSLATRFDLTVMILAHPPKYHENGEKAREYGGTVAWEAAVRARIYMGQNRPEHPDDWRILKASKQNYAASGTEEALLRMPSGAFVRKPAAEMAGRFDELVYDAISKAAMLEKALSTSPQSGPARYIYGAGMITDEHGRDIGREVIEGALRRLIQSNRVEENKGRKAGNGLFPAGMEP